MVDPSSPEEARTSLPHNNARFIRGALHLRDRAEAAGVSGGLALICPNRDYGLSHANAYQRALGEEPIRLVDACMRGVLLSPPPAEFSRLWANNLVHGLSHHVSEQDKIA